MKVDITHARAMAFCPTEAAGAIAALKASRSKFKNKDPKTLPWEFFWGEVIQAESFADVISGRKKKDAYADATTLADKIAARVARSTVSVCVKGYSAPLSVVPPEIVAEITKWETESWAEHERINALSPAEREAEFQAILGQLGRDGGFVVVGLSNGPP